MSKIKRKCKNRKYVFQKYKDMTFVGCKNTCENVYLDQWMNHEILQTEQKGIQRTPIEILIRNI